MFDKVYKYAKYTKPSFRRRPDKREVSRTSEGLPRRGERSESSSSFSLHSKSRSKWISAFAGMTESGGFTLIELLVALAVFATMAAMAWGGLDSVARTRSELALEQDNLRGLMHALGMLDRDLRAAVARPVRGNYGETVPAFLGGSDKLEF